MGINHDASMVVGYSTRLRAAGTTVGARGSAVFRKTVHDIESDAKTMAPVDTGALQNSISSTITGDGQFGGMSAEIGPTVDYAIYVHEGTSKMAGRPFLADAFDRRIPGFEAALEQIAEAGL